LVEWLVVELLLLLFLLFDCNLLLFFPVLGHMRFENQVGIKGVKYNGSHVLKFAANLIGHKCPMLISLCDKSIVIDSRWKNY
jgi:hypothetical protein